MSLISDMKGIVNAVANRAGYEVNRVDTTSTMAAAITRLRGRHPEIRTIIDVGASDGRWSRLVRESFPAASFLLFEALPKEHEEGLKRFERTDGAHIVRAAAGDRLGTVHFEASSLFGGAASETSFGEDDVVVPMTTIDHEVARLGLEPPFLLKLDTHGFELPVFAGADRTLDGTHAIVVEAYNFELRDGSPTFPYLCRHLEERGFRTVDLVDVMRRPTDDLLWQFDLVFARQDRPEFGSSTYR